LGLGADENTQIHGGKFIATHQHQVATVNGVGIGHRWYSSCHAKDVGSRNSSVGSELLGQHFGRNACTECASVIGQAVRHGTLNAVLVARDLIFGALGALSFGFTATVGAVVLQTTCEHRRNVVDGFGAVEQGERSI